MNDDKIDTRQKALALNLDATTYGTFAEIGAGQEVARWFFSVGGAAGTVAKSISAYDMAVSDALYGTAQRYVSRQRLIAMLDQEFAELRQRLESARGDAKRFFVFADTVATGGHKQQGHGGHGHAWLGIRFQNRPHEQPSEVIIHAHLFDSSAAGQREALGILGVNLIYGAFFGRGGPKASVASLIDELSRERVEIDMIKLSGPAFPKVDNRLMSLELVERGMTDAAMFTANGEVVQPSEVLYKKPILVERGSFRPATNLTLDLLHRALDQFLQEPEVVEGGQQPMVLAEMTLRSLVPGPDVGHEDFLARADILGALGLDVLISRFEPYHQLAEYLAAYTDRLIGIAVGIPTVQQIVDEQYYQNLGGGVLESVGRLFNRCVKMYVYPTRDEVTGQIRTLNDVVLPPPWQHLHDLLMGLGRVEAIRGFDESLLSIHTPDVLARIERGDSTWEAMVPPVVAEIIANKRLFRPASGRESLSLSRA